MFDLSEKVALVTAGNAGIGLAMARGLAKAGAAVAVTGRNAEKTEEAAASLLSLGARAKGYVCDATDENAVADTTAAVLADFGRIDACFANAGGGTPKPFLETDPERWRRGIALNLDSVYLSFRSVLEHVVERGGGGKLVATASIGAMHGMPGQEAYSSAKAALCALVRSLAVEFARHDVQANAIVPGWIETDMTAPAKAFEKLDKTVVRRTPARRWGKPEDFEGIAVYLASNESRFHTGDVIRIDGGYAIF